MKKQIQAKLEQLEKDKRRRNLIITRIDMDSIEERHLKEAMGDVIEKGLELKVKLSSAEKIEQQKYINYER